MHTQSSHCTIFTLPTQFFDYYFHIVATMGMFFLFCFLIILVKQAIAHRPSYNNQPRHFLTMLAIINVELSSSYSQIFFIQCYSTPFRRVLYQAEEMLLARKSKNKLFSLKDIRSRLCRANLSIGITSLFFLYFFKWLTTKLLPTFSYTQVSKQ